MRRYFSAVFILLLIGSALAVAAPAAADQYCFCATDISKVDQRQDLGDSTKVGFVPCFGADASVCNPDSLRASGASGNLEQLACDPLYQTQAGCEARVQTWKSDLTRAQSQAGASNQAFGFSGKIIPACLLADRLSDQCKDINVFVIALVNVGRYLFTIIGAVALAAFVYGGFLLILSQGNSEKVKSGTDAIVAAVIGLAVAFGGYVLIRFVGQVVGIEQIFRL